MTATLAAFFITDFSYCSLDGTSIPASALVPKDLQPGKYPCIIRWHGGCFITGHRLYPRWYGTWTLSLALTRSAVILAPDYWLLPEASGIDILRDVRGFYSWLNTDNLAAVLPGGVQLDLEDLLVFGESAGGWMAVQSALLDESRGKVAAIVARYPMLDLRDRFYCEAYEKVIFNPPASQLGTEVVDRHLEKIEGRDLTVISVFPPERTPLVIAAMQHGMLEKWMGDTRDLHPLEVLDVKRIQTPMWILHGLEDNVVPIEGTYKFVEKVQSASTDCEIHVSYETGMRGFDNQEETTLDTPWVRSGLTFLEKFWPCREGGKTPGLALKERNCCMIDRSFSVGFGSRILYLISYISALLFCQDQRPCVHTYLSPSLQCRCQVILATRNLFTARTDIDHRCAEGTDFERAERTAILPAECGPRSRKCSLPQP